MKLKKSRIKTIKIPYHDGRICYITESSSGQNITVECYDVKKAFRFLYDEKHPIHVGDWIRFCGTARINTVVQKNGKTEEKIGYYHKPHDGSFKHNWIFLEIQKTKMKFIAPPDIMRCLKETIIHTRRMENSWTFNRTMSDIKKTIEVLLNTVDALKLEFKNQEAIEKDKNIKIEMIEIKI